MTNPESWPPGTVGVATLEQIFAYPPDHDLYRWVVNEGSHTHYWFKDKWVEIKPEEDDEPHP